MNPLPREIGLAFDMFGCPNRCRHCFIGAVPNRRLSEDTVRRVVGSFRTFVRAGQLGPQFTSIKVSTWMREPDFSDDYQRLHELEVELSDGPPVRYELLSIWRLARDAGYPQWAKSVGPDTCQITFFGMAETTDWFCRRRGAFADALAATEELLRVGMKPRWQVFANGRGIGELDELMTLVDTMKLHQRVESLGGRFHIFIHPYGAYGESLKVEALRPTAEQMRRIPKALLESSRRHFGREVPWETQAELYRQIKSRLAWSPYGIEPVSVPWFVMDGDLNVYFNGHGYEPWFGLGNLHREPLGVVLKRFENEDTPGLRMMRQTTPQELAGRYGDAGGQKIYSDVNDLLLLYLARACGGETS